MNTKHLVGMPTRWSICACCHGEGRVENPAFAGGFTSSEWDEMRSEYDGDGEFSESDRYMRGDFDVSCTECAGAGKVREPDMARLTFAQKRALAAARREERDEAQWMAEAAAERAAERRMGC